jgi:hypothetical protein
MMDKTDYFNSIDEIPKECRVCGANDFRPIRRVEMDNKFYVIFQCQLCRHEIFIKQ